MPAISMFYGIVIYLYFFDDERHSMPHIHARYQGQQASLSISDGAILSGELPVAKARLVQAWIEDPPRSVDGRLGTSGSGAASVFD